jgi:metal-responsive CopG/Arc/MetJ family transcriptional regulator
MKKKLPKNKVIDIRIEEKTYNRIKKLAQRHSKGSVSKFLRGIIKVYLSNYGRIQKENQKEVGEAKGRTKRVMAARLFVMEAEGQSEAD